jgi:type II secretory pathway component PulJ
MTLIEILVALSVSTLILTVALSIYFTFSNSLRRLGDPRHREMTIALDTLRHDIAASVQASFTNSPTCELESEPVGLEGRFRSTLTLHVAQSPSGEQSLPQMTIARLRYSLQNNSPAIGSSLVRESVTLWGPDAMSPPVSNAMGHDISGFEVRVLDKAGWTNRWKSTPGHLLPRAARIRMDWQGAHTTETASLIVFIPAGNSFPAPTGKTNTVNGRTKPSRADSAAPTPMPPRASEKTSPHAPP